MHSPTTAIVLFIIIIICDATDKVQHDPDSIMFPSENSDERFASPRMNYHQNHHHHHQNGFSPDKPIYKAVETGSNDLEIPLEFLKKLSEVDDIEAFSKYLEGNTNIVQDISISSRFGEVERAAAIMPKPANCIPTLQTVELKSSNDSNLFYFPSCTRVERCGGCCSHSLLSCQPTHTETVSYQVLVSQYSGGNKLSVKGKEIVLVDKHTKCRCDCIIKQENCNSFQEYRKDECRCVCTNLDERKKCDKNNETKLWDPNVCKCLCRNVTECSTGLYFDQNKCSCIPIPVRRRFAELDSSKERSFTDSESYNIEPLAVAPLKGIKIEKKQDI